VRIKERENYFVVLFGKVCCFFEIAFEGVVFCVQQKKIVKFPKDKPSRTHLTILIVFH